MFLSVTPNANRILVNTVIYFENARLFVPFDILVTCISFTEHGEMLPLCCPRAEGSDKWGHTGATGQGLCGNSKILFLIEE